MSLTQNRWLLAAVCFLALLALAGAGCSGRGGGSDSIVFVSERDGNPEIYVARQNGDNPRRLTNTLARESSPMWSPDRRQIAFLSDRVSTDGSKTDLFVMNANGESQLIVGGGTGNRTGFAWSPDGKHIALVSDHEGIPLVYVHDLQEKTQFRLSTIQAEQQLGGWSPDGRWIVFAVLEGEQQGIHRKNPWGVDEVRLTDRADFDPLYSPNGRQIAFVSYRDGADTDIYVMNEDGTGLENVTKSSGNDADFHWSPDSRRLVFISDREGNPEIYTTTLDGRDVKRLTHNRAVERGPRWSADGRRIVFASDSDGDFDIYTMRSDGSDQQRVTATNRSETSPDW